MSYIIVTDLKKYLSELKEYNYHDSLNKAYTTIYYNYLAILLKFNLLLYLITI